MAKNKTLELSIKIAGQVDKSLTAALSDTQSRLGALSQTISRVGTVGLAAMGALATGTAAAIANCAKVAEEFEADMGDVVKYVDGLADASGKISDLVSAETGKTYAENYEMMKDTLLDLSTQIPMTAEELTQLAAIAGQSGKSITDIVQYDESGNITGFLKDVAMMGTAMDVSAEQASEWAVKWEKAFNMNHEEIMVLTDQINYLGANSATTAAEIANVVNDAASLGQIGGLDVSTTAALADAVLAMGVDSGRAATSVRRLLTNMSLGESATAAQKEMWESLGFTASGVAKSMQEDSVETIKAVFTAINSLDADKQVGALKTLFGQWSIEGAAKLTGNLQAFVDAMEMVSDPSLYTGSMEREFIIKASTAESIDTMMSNAFYALRQDIGESFLPVKKEFSVMMIDIMNGIRENMPELTQLAETLAGLLSDGVSKLGSALQEALPYVQKALDYVANNGQEVASTLGELAAAFAAMKYLPTGIKAVSTIKNLLTGEGFSSGGTFLTRLIGKGGLFGSGGVLETAKEIWGAAKIEVAQYAAGGKAGFGATLGTALTSLLPQNEVTALYGLAGKLGSGATTALGSAAAGAGAVTGGLLGAAGLGSGLYDIYRGTQTNGKEAKDNYFSGGTKIGMVGIGAATGAAIGSVVPVVGTAAGALIGAGVGGVGAMLAGSGAGKSLSDATDEGGVLNVFFTQTIPQKWGEFWSAVGNFFTQTVPAGISIVGEKLNAFFTQTVPEFFSSLWDGVGNFITQTVPYAIGYAVGKVQIFFTQTVPQAWSSFWSAVGNFFTVTIPTWASSVWNDNIVPFFTQTVPSFLTNLWQSIGSFFMETLPSIASTIWNGIVGFFTETIPNWIGSVWQSVTGSFSAGYKDATGQTSGAIPAYADGGFTRGISIAGEAGPEAVISFRRGVREDNIGTWMQAGRMLGVNGAQAAQAAGVTNVRYFADGGFTGNAGAVELATMDAAHGNNAAELADVETRPGGSGGDYAGGQIVFAPQITIQGNADRDVLEETVEDMRQQFESWYEQMQRRRARTAY